MRIQRHPWAWPAAIAIVSQVAAACGGTDSPAAADAGPTRDGGPTARDGAIGDGGSTVDGAVPTVDGGPCDGTACPRPGDLVAPPAQVGVVYAAHYWSPELRLYRIDNAAAVDGQPVFESMVTLEQNARDLALDARHDLLAVVPQEGGDNLVRLMRVHRPTAIADAVVPPEFIKEVVVSHTPLYAAFNSLRSRLYVLTMQPSTGPSAVRETFLHAFDVTDPAAPAEVSGSPFTLPATATRFGLDEHRDLLFVVEANSHLLHVFDLHDDGLAPLGQDPIDLRAAYPQTNSSAFVPRYPVADPYRNRVYLAREQGVMSELVAYEYPPHVPGVPYSSVAGHDDFTMVADAFDIDEDDLALRQQIFRAFEPMIDPIRGHVFMTAGGHTGRQVAGLLVAFDSTLALGDGCGDYEGIGCWLFRLGSDHETRTEVPTQGAGCVDYTRQVVVAASVAAFDETEPALLHAYRYDDGLDMTPWLPAGGENLRASSLPVALVCH